MDSLHLRRSAWIGACPDEAYARFENADLSPVEGFYKSLGSSCDPVLVLQRRGQGMGQGSRARYMLHWPHVSANALEGVLVSERLLSRRGVRCSSEPSELEAFAERWKEKFASSSVCRLSQPSASKKGSQRDCAHCLRFTTRLLITGQALFARWETVQRELGPSPLYRVRTSCGRSFVGTTLPDAAHAERLRKVLEDAPENADDISPKGVVELCESSDENGNDGRVADDAEDKADVKADEQAIEQADDTSGTGVVELLSSGDEEEGPPSKRLRTEK